MGSRAVSETPGSRIKMRGASVVGRILPMLNLLTERIQDP